MSQRCNSVSIRECYAGTCFYQCPDGLDMRCTPAAQDYRLNQSGPAQVINVIQWRAPGDQAPDNLGVAKMRGCDKGCSIIDACYQIRPMTRVTPLQHARARGFDAIVSILRDG